MRTSLVADIADSRKPASRYLACLRVRDIIILQGTPLMGAAFALQSGSAGQIGRLALLALANACLVAHVFALNDLVNERADRVDAARAAHVFTARGVTRAEMGVLTAGLLVLSLALFSRLGPSVLCAAAGVAVFGSLYSLPPFDWKGRPVLSSAAHLCGGALHFLVGYSLASAIDGRGLVIAVVFGLTFAAGHLTQELRDYRTDARNHIMTNAVRFGRRPTLVASLALFTLAQVVLFGLALAGTIPRVLAVLLMLYPLHLRWSLRALAEGLTRTGICRLQTRYRALHALIGLTMVAALWLA